MHDELAFSFCSAVKRSGVRECHYRRAGSHREGFLSVIVVFDYPFALEALDEALFSLAVQDWEQLEVILVLPDCGRELHRDLEAAILVHAWPPTAQAIVVSVATRSERALSADLLTAGITQATGRYLAFLHHQDLIYHHAYPLLIEHLERSDRAAAFGGIRRAHHQRGSRHWQVLSKHAPQSRASRLGHFLAGAAIHCFVADRSRLEADYLRVYNPSSPLATSLFLLRLWLHPKSDFSLATTPVCECRRFTSLPQSDVASNTGIQSGDGRLPGLDRILTALESGDLILRDTVVSPQILLAETIRTLA